MMRASVLALVLLLLPSSLFAATVQGARTMVLSEPPEGNAYLLAADMTVAVPIMGDIIALAGGMVTSALVTGDAMLFGGSIDVRKGITGDLRAIGARITVEDGVMGDITALGGTITVHSTPAYAWIGGARVTLTNGAEGDVTIYGSTIVLGGTFEGDIDVVASDRITLEEGTVINGSLRYDAPQQVEVPEGVTVAGGVTYTGKSYLPTTEEAYTFAIAGVVLFFLIKILAAVIAAGLLAGIFPVFAQAVADRTLSYSVNRFLMLTALGFAILVAAPVLILLLLLSFAGAIVAIVLLAAYILLLLLAYLYAAVIAGAALSRAISKRSAFLWRDAVFGMLALSLVGLVPYLGWIVILFLVATAAGAIASFFYALAFMHEEEDLTFE